MDTFDFRKQQIRLLTSLQYLYLALHYILPSHFRYFFMIWMTPGNSSYGTDNTEISKLFSSKKGQRLEGGSMYQRCRILSDLRNLYKSKMNPFSIVCFSCCRLIDCHTVCTTYNTLRFTMECGSANSERGSSDVCEHLLVNCE